MRLHVQDINTTSYKTINNMTVLTEFNALHMQAWIYIAAVALEINELLFKCFRISS